MIDVKRHDDDIEKLGSVKLQHGDVNYRKDIDIDNILEEVKDKRIKRLQDEIDKLKNT